MSFGTCIIDTLMVRKHTIDVPPGTKRSYRVTADALGRWAYHCHLLYHMNGTEDRLQIKNDMIGTSSYSLSYDGVAKYILMQQDNDASATAQKWAGQFIKVVSCPECGGQRLDREALSYRIAGKNIAEVCEMDIKDLSIWLNGLDEQLDERQQKIAVEILKEIRSRVRFLLDVGLGYLSLNRASSTLSGGESQRIRLATQIGSQLVNVLYILDEPSIGLHQRDNMRLINSLKELRDANNSVIVVEHDGTSISKAN